MQADPGKLLSSGSSFNADDLNDLDFWLWLHFFSFWRWIRGPRPL